MYKYGGTVWAIIYLLLGILEAGTLSGGAEILMDVYVMKLFGWPWNELFLADTVSGLLRSHVQTWFVGWIVATAKFGLNS
jgi:hypothetical protein